MTFDLEQRENLYELLDLLFDDQLDATGYKRLSALLDSDDEALGIYLSEMNRHAALAWDWSIGEEEGGEVREERESDSELSPPAPNPSSPCVILDSSPQSSFPSFVGSWMFSNLFALIVMGIGVLGAWFYQIDIPQQVTRVDRPMASPGKSSGVEKLTFVGQVTGMVDVRWADESTGALGGARVPLGRKYALASGLMEITYDTGAKVILQGPVTYQVDSRDGGFLSVGRLTARLDSAKPQAANQKSPLSTIHYPLFTIKTPSAVVTDLGTEFGVEVSKNGDCECQVFQGVVETTIVRQGQSIGLPCRVVEGQVARIAAGDSSTSPRIELIAKDLKANPKKFVRTLQSPSRSSGWVHCKWETGPSGTFKVSNDDLINVGQKTFSAIELTSGEAGWQSSVTMLNEGGIYHGMETQVSDYTFNPKDKAVVTITLNTAIHPQGYDIKSIVTLTGSAGDGQNRSSQKYDLAYSTVGNPDKYIKLHGDNAATVNWYTDTPEARATLTDARGGLIALGAAKLRFTIYRTTSRDPESMYREIDVFGIPAKATDQEMLPVEKSESTLPVTIPSKNGGGDKADSGR